MRTQSLERKVWGDRAAVGDARRTQVAVVPSDYAQDRNQSRSSSGREDHGWQGGQGDRRRGRGGREGERVEEIEP